MTTIRAGVPIAGDPEATRAVWYDTGRWPAFVDGFGHIVEQDADWPASGTVVWDSTSAGQGRTRETVVDTDTVEIETEDFRARRSVAFAEDGVRVAFDYQLKQRSLFGFFIRGSLRDSLQRTLDRFAAELRT